MDDRTTASPAPRLLKAADGVVMGDPAGVRDRFMIDGEDAGGRFALVQHLFAPQALAAPLHRHHREDEYTYVLFGRIGAVLGDDELVAEPGDLVFKPRNQWHTFWNAGDEPAAVLELIPPRGSSSSSAGSAAWPNRRRRSSSPRWPPLTSATPTPTEPSGSSSGTA
jgi:quercetin dioxygenase-like cupin family protein